MSNTTKRSRYIKGGNLTDAQGKGRLFPVNAEEVAYKKRMSEHRARLDARQNMHHKMGVSKYYFDSLFTKKYRKVSQRGG